MTEPLRILMLAANPIDKYRLALTDEYRLLRNRMHANAEAGACDLRVEWAARAEDLQRALMETRPQIVHFSGHGHDTSICLEDDERRSRPLSKFELGLLFNLSRSWLRIVVLNACYSTRQVESLLQFVDFIVGTNVPVADDTAVHFTNDFYRAIATGSTVREAFTKAQANGTRTSGYELLVRPGADETTPLLPPIVRRGIGIGADEMIASEWNVAHEIREGVDAFSANSEPVSNENSEMQLRAKRIDVGKFNFASKILKQS